MAMKTALYDQHAALGGKLVEFAGFMLPIQYAGVIKEHLAVRKEAGIFDVSHMAECMVEGPEAGAYLDWLLTNRLSNCKPGQMKYSCMCYEDGGIVDDLIVYCFNAEKYMLVLNASNHEKDMEWILAHRKEGVEISDVSDSISQLALQGPKAIDILKKLVREEDIPLQYYYFKDAVQLCGHEVIISRNGYTGEDGVEIYMRNEAASEIFQALLECGQEYGLQPCGLGARDTLRLEAGMPLYGHEMSKDINPLDAGLKFAVKLDKDFIGKEALENAVSNRKRVGLQLLDRGIAREGYEVYDNNRLIGTVTSGTMSPLTSQAIAMAYLDNPYGQLQDIVEVDCRGRRINAEIVALPFYKRK